MGSRKRLHEVMYDRAKGESQLGWYRKDVPLLIEDAVKRTSSGGKALDLGCGTGLNAIYLARHGLDVTGVDLIPSALDLARKNADAAGEKIRFVRADVLEWETPDRFDLIIDSGCLHSLSGDSRQKYRSQLLSWLDPLSSSYVLIHFAKCHLNSINVLGPKKRTREDIERFFAPELILERCFEETGKEPLNEYLFLPVK